MEGKDTSIILSKTIWLEIISNVAQLEPSCISHKKPTPYKS